MALNYIFKFMLFIKSNWPSAMSASDNATLVSTEAFYVTVVIIPVTVVMSTILFVLL